jgi:hypothetical protein
MGTTETRRVPHNALYNAMARYAEATTREKGVLECMHAEMEEVADRYRDSLTALADSRKQASEAVRRLYESTCGTSYSPSQVETPLGTVGFRPNKHPSTPFRFFINLRAAHNPFRPTPLCRPL